MTFSSTIRNFRPLKCADRDGFNFNSSQVNLHPCDIENGDNKATTKVSTFRFEVLVNKSDIVTADNRKGTFHFNYLPILRYVLF